MHGVFGYSRWKNDEFLAAIAHWFSTQHYTAIDTQTVVYGPSVIYMVSELIRQWSETGEGVVIHTPEKSYDIPPAHERRVVDPTGCGDAFRAGLIYGIQKGYDWLTIGRMGNLMGALKVEHPGTQNQRFTFDEFNEQFKQQFGYALSA